MKHLLPLLLLASCEPLSIIHDDLTDSGPNWGEGSTNPNLSDLCTVHDSTLDSFGYVGDFPANEAYHLCGEVSAEDDWLSVSYLPTPFTLNLETATYGYTTALVTVVEWPADLPNALKDNSFTVLDQFEVDGTVTRSYYIEPSEENAFMTIIVKALNTSNFNEYYLRIEHGL